MFSFEARENPLFLMLRKKSTKLQDIILIAEQILPTSIQLSNKSNGEFDLSIWNTTYDEAFELSSLSVHRAEKSNKNNNLYSEHSWLQSGVHFFPIKLADKFTFL